MQSKTFTYDGVSLADMGYIVCKFDGGGASLDGIKTDSQRDWDNISVMWGKFMPWTVSTFGDRLEMEFSIMKEPCGDNSLLITPAEMVQLKRWLSRPVAKVLRFPEEPGFENIYYEGSFNVEEVWLNTEGRYGANLTFTCNAPAGFYDFEPIEGTLDTDGELVIKDISDEVGWIYPTLKVTVHADGDLRLFNSYDARSTLVKNCKAGEVITFYNSQQITSSRSRSIGDDFNFRFLRIYNDYLNNENIITTNLPISYEFTYKPIAKAVMA